MTQSAAIDPLEERFIDQEYKIWKKNTPFLYDFVLTHSLEWASLTCQWLPTVKTLGDHATEHPLLIGTHTSDGEQNYLMTAHCVLPTPQQVDDSKPHYDEDKNEVGGFGFAQSNVGKIEIKMKVKHDGEVHRARYMPQNHFVVASRGPNAEVYLFDLSKHPSFPTKESVFLPQATCIGHTGEGYGMVWSPHQEGYLLTASEDTTVRLWDTQEAVAKAENGTQIQSKAVFAGHTAGVEDVDWHKLDPNMIGSVGDDRNIFIWDIREPSKPVKKAEKAHKGDVMSISFNPKQEFLFATGSSDKNIAIWDLRNLEK